MMAVAIIFFILSGIAFWAGVVGLIKPKLVTWGKQRNRKKVLGIYGPLWVVFLLIWIISLPKTANVPAAASANSSSQNTKVQEQTTTSSKQTTKPASKPVSKPQAPKVKNLKQVAIDAVHKVIPSSTIMKNGDAFLGFSTDNGQLIVQVEAEDNLTHGLIKSGILMDTSQIIHQMFADKRVNDVLLDWYFPETDAYGNDSNQIAEKIEFTRDTVNKINWDNFISSNIPQIADDFEVNPAFDNTSSN